MFSATKYKLKPQVAIKGPGPVAQPPTFRFSTGLALTPGLALAPVKAKSQSKRDLFEY